MNIDVVVVPFDDDLVGMSVVVVVVMMIVGMRLGFGGTTVVVVMVVAVVVVVGLGRAPSVRTETCSLGKTFMAEHRRRHRGTTGEGAVVNSDMFVVAIDDDRWAVVPVVVVVIVGNMVVVPFNDYSVRVVVAALHGSVVVLLEALVITLRVLAREDVAHRDATRTHPQVPHPRDGIGVPSGPLPAR